MQQRDFWAEFEQALQRGNEARFVHRLLSKESGERKRRFFLFQMYAVASRELFLLRGKIPPMPDRITQKHLLSLCGILQSAKKRSASSESADLCEKALHLIRVQYKDADLSLARLGKAVGASPSYLSRSIKAYTGKNYMTLLSEKRCAAAKEYLRYSSMKIREIAEQVGYSDPHYFSHSFKHVTGIAPNAYRKMYKREKS